MCTHAQKTEKEKESYSLELGQAGSFRGHLEAERAKIDRLLGHGGCCPTEATEGRGYAG